MSAEIVPFGKYKGQPVELLAADRDYCDWLVAQPWFSDKYRNVYNIIVNYGSEPQDSPEHNQMQALFLEDEWCFALADLVYPKRKGAYGIDAALACMEADALFQKFGECFNKLEKHPATTFGRTFEHQGWDVIYGIEAAGVLAVRQSLVPPLPPCTCRCDHSKCASTAVCRDGKAYCRHSSCRDRRGIDEYDHCCDDCYWKSLPYEHREWLKSPHHYYEPGHGGVIHVELKPDLGDDYPSVLRQVKGYPCDRHGSTRCVVVRRFAFQHVTWEMVQKIFAASDVLLVSEDSIHPDTP